MDTTPLLPRPANSSGRTDSHPIYLRACHSPWRLIDQPLLLFLRLILAGYLSAVFGVSLKYKLENEDGHTRWRIPFQFSTVSFVLQWVYHLVVTLWTAMHLAFPKALEENPEDCHGHRLRTRILQFLSPPNEATCPARRYLFSMFYTMSHVFPFMNTLIYWGILVPSGHGGFKPPNFPHNHTPPAGNASALYDPNKGLFEEDDIKAFSIINVWTITTVIGLIEIAGLNSIRRPTPVAAHVAGVMFASGAYLAWAGIGKLATGHSGLFFLDPDLMSNIPGAVIAACIAFITVSPGIFSYFYGLIAMRETMAAVHHRESSE
ncbi:hypothetical protein F4779DRAFT_623848 [Xylariaceae sp. FL0662B]|nr:hypothetical protein F4779DRAFT_623848 [Xylariaceae sp. FL0662B]